MKIFFLILFIWLFIWPLSSLMAEPLMRQTAAEAEAKSVGCLSCHRGIEPEHPPTVRLGCIDCDGGNNIAVLSPGVLSGT